MSGLSYSVTCDPLTRQKVVRFSCCETEARMNFETMLAETSEAVMEAFDELVGTHRCGPDASRALSARQLATRKAP